MNARSLPIAALPTWEAVPTIDATEVVEQLLSEYVARAAEQRCSRPPSLVLAGGTPGAAGLHPRRLARRLRGAEPEGTVQGGRTAGHRRAYVGGSSGECACLRAAQDTADRATTTTVDGDRAGCRTAR